MKKKILIRSVLLLVFSTISITFNYIILIKTKKHTSFKQAEAYRHKNPKIIITKVNTELKERQKSYSSIDVKDYIEQDNYKKTE